MQSPVTFRFQTLDEQELFTDEEFEEYQRLYEERRRKFFEDPDAQPGEVNVSLIGNTRWRNLIVNQNLVQHAH